MSYNSCSIDVLDEPCPHAPHHHETLRISDFELISFRNHSQLHFKIDNPLVILVGANGSGKTSILEAISLLTSGRGLNHEKLQNLQQRSEQKSSETSFVNMTTHTIPHTIPWSVGAKIHTEESSFHIGTYLNNNKRIIHINGEAKKQQELSNICSVFWLTPDMDSLIRESSYAKRRFLDSIISRFDSNHAKLVYRCDALQRKYNIIRVEPSKHDFWNHTIIEELTATAIALTSSRRGFVGRFNRIALATDNALPRVTLELYGKLASWYDEMGSQFAENQCSQHLKDNLNNCHDSQNPFLHLNDCLNIKTSQDYIDTSLRSSGERKSFLISIMLTITRMWKADRGFAPILLLDDITSHLDKNMRESLWQDIIELKAQTWISCQEILDINDLTNITDIFQISPGEAKRINP